MSLLPVLILNRVLFTWNISREAVSLEARSRRFEWWILLWGLCHRYVEINEINTFRLHHKSNLTLAVVMMLMTEICVQHIWLNLVKQWTMRIMGSTYDPGRLQPLSHQIIVSLSFIIKMLCSRRSIVMFVIMLVLKETSFGIFKMSSFFIQDRQWWRYHRRLFNQSPYF